MARRPSPLLSLPAELQIKVVEELYEDPPCPYEDPLAKDTFLEHIRTVRLTCKSLKAAATDTFLKTWFSHRSIVLERKSLLNFYQIATTSPFNRRIAQLDVAAYEFRPELAKDFTVFLSRMEKEARDESCFLRHDRVKEHFLGDAERAADWPNARAAYDAYKRHADDQIKLFDRFAHIRLLARALKAFSGLGSLRTISVNGAQSPLTGAWTSGILQECGISLLHKEKIALHSVTMGSVIRAMALSEVELCTLVTAGLNAGALQLSTPQRRRFGNVGLGHLHNLSLRLLDPKLFPSEAGSALFRSGLLSRFVQQVRNLTNLSIEFYNQPYDVPLAKLLGRRIEKLESLSLGGLAYHAHDLVEWLTENGSKLEHLQLDYSSLITGTWRDVFRKMRSNLDLKSVYFHFLADDEESIHITASLHSIIITIITITTTISTITTTIMDSMVQIMLRVEMDTATIKPMELRSPQVLLRLRATHPLLKLRHRATAPHPKLPLHQAMRLAQLMELLEVLMALPTSALGVSLDFLDDLDDADDADLSDSFDDDDNEEFNDEEVSDDDSDTEDDDESDIVDEQDEQDDDGYMTDDSVAEAIVGGIISEL
ncbi:hypothetical protein UCDDS831_g02261 [Diplodia seriata]|uniref:Uncharacterized protein n=1 Tax=Diplodia seriata TaxID=420778 RepID=A0A0G2GMH3_9PEZI|nr:hypothetical protein UCDDS831_g02261 [Diplodia seriata]